MTSIRVGIVVERRRATSPWAEYLWQSVAVLPDEPAARPWTVMREQGDTTTFYAGPAQIDLHRAETANYRDNLTAPAPGLWVVLRQTGGDPPYRVVKVTADPAEGEAYTEAGTDVVDQVALPSSIRAVIESFVAEHHVERPFYKRERAAADPQSHVRRPAEREGGE